MTEHMSIKNRVKCIDRRSTFNAILEDSMLSDLEKKLITMHYVEGKNFDFIADTMGYSKAGILKMHKRALRKIENLL